MTPEGFNIGSCDKNLKFHSISCEVEFSDGYVNDYSADAIVENSLTMFAWKISYL